MLRALTSTRMQPCSYLITAILVIGIHSQVVSATATVTIRLDRYINAEGKKGDGNCCDGVSIFCSGQCDPVFLICLDHQHSTNNDMDHCPLGQHLTGVTEDQNNIVFGGNIGGTANPQQYRMQTWMGGVLMKVRVTDKDDRHLGELVEVLTSDIQQQPDGIQRSHEIAGRTRLFVDMTVSCNPNYYGIDCGELCTAPAPEDHYICDEDTGIKICTDGWEGPDCDEQRHPCTYSPCLNRARCIGDVDFGNYTCICEDKFIGVNCERREVCDDDPCRGPSQCHNTDDGTFHCFCVDGWTGDRCEQTVSICEMDEPCENGECRENRTSSSAAYYCLCNPGWTGFDCHQDINECEDNPCNGSQECLNTAGSYECYCSNGGIGNNCTLTTASPTTSLPSTSLPPVRLPSTSLPVTSLPLTSLPLTSIPTEFTPGVSSEETVTAEEALNPCTMNPCQNGGDCWVASGTGDTMCTCMEKYSGRFCQHLNDEKKEQVLYGVGKKYIESKKSLAEVLSLAASRYVTPSNDDVTISHDDVNTIIILFDCKDDENREEERQVLSVAIMVRNKWMSSEIVQRVLQEVTGTESVDILMKNATANCRAEGDTRHPEYGAASRDTSRDNILFFVLAMTMVSLLALGTGCIILIHKKRQKKKKKASSAMVRGEEGPEAPMLVQQQRQDMGSPHRITRL